MLFTIIYDLFHFPARSIFWGAELILALFIYYKLKIPSGTYFAVLVLFLMNIFGEIFFGLFYIIQNFDKFIHLFSSFAVCTLFYSIFEKKISSKKILILFSFTIVLSIELIWEITEYFADNWFHLILAGVHIAGEQAFKPIEMVSSYEDTIYDMLLNFIGGTIFAITALFLTRTKKKLAKNSKKECHHKV